jgi:hypothetical protein
MESVAKFPANSNEHGSDLQWRRRYKRRTKIGDNIKVIKGTRIARQLARVYSQSSRGVKLGRIAFLSNTRQYVHVLITKRKNGDCWNQ